MRKLLGALAIVVVVGGLLPSVAPAAPAAVSIRCLQISPNNTAASCTYKSTAFEKEVLTAFAQRSYTLDWVENGSPRHVACTAGPCSAPGLAFRADAGTTIRVTVTKGVVVVRQVVAAPPA